MIVSRRSSRIENDLLEYRNFFSVGPSLLQLRFLAQMIESFPPAYGSRTAAAKKYCRSLYTRLFRRRLSEEPSTKCVSSNFPQENLSFDKEVNSGKGNLFASERSKLMRSSMRQISVHRRGYSQFPAGSIFFVVRTNTSINRCRR